MSDTILTNDASTTLAGAMDAVQTSLSVQDGSAFPSGGNFHIRIDNEVILVTAVSGNTWTVTRAYESVNGVQAAATHIAQSAVYAVLTVAAMTAGGAPGDYVNPQVTLDAYGRLKTIANGQNHFFAQHGAPSNGSGVEGDYSIDVDTGVVYRKQP